MTESIGVLYAVIGIIMVGVAIHALYSYNNENES